MGKDTTQHTQRSFAASTCDGLVTDLLQASRGETGVMGFGLYAAMSPLRLCTTL